MRKTIYVADLFAGCGGATAAVVQAVARMEGNPKLELVAVNHWPAAVDTHAANYPDFVHYCEAVDRVDPRQAVPGGYLDALVAGIVCTHHSNARGGKPRNKQSRATAFDIIWWLECLTVRSVLIENVREFQTWGPLDENDKPIPALKGMYYRLFCDTLRELGYTLEHRILCAADFGDATTRQRFFLQATKVGLPAWPQATHQDKSAPRKGKKRVITDEALLPWVSARAVIDLSLPSVSIYDRQAHGKLDLKPNTIRRIYTGFRKFAPLPFLAQLNNGTDGKAMNAPMPTLCTQDHLWVCEPVFEPGNHYYLAEPWVMQASRFSDDDACNVFSPGRPIPTLVTRNQFGVVESILETVSREAFVLQTAHNSERADGDKRRCNTLDVPLVTLVAKNELGIVTSFVLPNEGFFGGNVARSMDEPLPTGTQRGMGHFVQPYFVGAGGPQGQGEPRSINAPLRTLLGKNSSGLCEPFLYRYNGGGRIQSLDEPLTTLDTSNRFALCQFTLSPCGTTATVSDPDADPTIADRFALLQIVVEGDGQMRASVVGWVDILFRMLAVSEMAAAHSFPKSFVFTGDSREAHVKMIGNSWPVQMGAAIVHAMLTRKEGTGRPPWIPAPPKQSAPFVQYARALALSDTIPVLQPKLDFDGTAPGLSPLLPGRRAA